MFDIYKVNRLSKKALSNKSMSENGIIVDDCIYKGRDEVLTIVSEVIKERVSGLNESADFLSIGEPTDDEAIFLDLFPKLTITENENKILEEDPDEEDFISMLKDNNLKLDGAPGEDGLTYLFYKTFMGQISELFMPMAKYVLKNAKLSELINNAKGIFIDKKLKYHDGPVNLDKKRFLRLRNVDLRLIIRLWTKKFLRVVVPKVISPFQLCCNTDLNLTDSNFEFREEIIALNSSDESLGDMDASYLECDLIAAFDHMKRRYTSLMFNRFVEDGMSSLFASQYSAFNKNLTVQIFLDGAKSEKIKVVNGHDQGSPESQPVFCIEVSPILTLLDKLLKGITLLGKRRSVRGFSDNSSMWISDPTEINKVESVYSKARNAMGLILHTDPKKEKNPTVSWGRNKLIPARDWAPWISLKNECTFLGFPVSNSESPEVTTLKLLKQLTQAEFCKWMPVGGTLYQRATTVNSLMLSRWWFNGQTVKIDQDACRKILNQMKTYIYQQCDEKPKECVSFRPTQSGGLGLHHPFIKHKALIIKNMLRKRDRDEREKEKGKSVVALDHGYGAVEVHSTENSADHDYTRAILPSFSDHDELMEGEGSPEVEEAYGYVSDMKHIEKVLGSGMKKSMEIYGVLIQKVTHESKEKPIKSRAELKWDSVHWSTVWENHAKLRRVSPLVKERSFQIKHDILPGLRSRAFKHRVRIGPHDTRCPEVFGGQQCQEAETLEHFYIHCEGVKDIFKSLKEKLLTYTENINKYPPVSDISFLMGDFKADPVKTRTAIWTLSVILSRIYDLKRSGKSLDFEECWNWAAEDLRIANLCKVGRKLDEGLFSQEL